MKTHVEFRSDLFPAYPGEEEEINPGIWGRRLAEHLSAGLKQHGIPTREPFAEDWGWVVPIENESFPLWLGCANYPEYPDGFLCFVEPSKPFVRRLFRKIPTESRVLQVTKALASLLASNASIKDIRWWTEHDFNNPGTEQGAGNMLPRTADKLSK